METDVSKLVRRLQEGKSASGNFLSRRHGRARAKVDGRYACTVSREVSIYTTLDFFSFLYTASLFEPLSPGIAIYDMLFIIFFMLSTHKHTSVWYIQRLFRQWSPLLHRKTD